MSTDATDTNIEILGGCTIAQDMGLAAKVVPGDVPGTPCMAKATREVKVFKFIDSSKPAAALSWEGLGFSVSDKSARKDILKSVTGDLRPGELTCILGPSGSGKTSLLNLLAGRVRRGGKNGAAIQGQVSVNGQVIEPTAYQGLFGYVMQDDALLGTTTPREILQFAAKLRLGGTQGEDQSALIEDLLDGLGLAKCANTMVGNELIKGISGGERKRTAVGAELITNPMITFLDEPTSGLDTGSAYNVVSVLKQLTQLKRSVLCTIHQPSSEIFHLFDQAIFLSGGAVAYRGSPGGIREHFNKLSLACPQDYNPADFVMFSIMDEDEGKVASIVRGWSEHGAVREPMEARGEQLAVPKPQKRKGFCVQFAELSKREFKNVVRDKGTTGARFGITLFLTALYGLIFFRVGSPGDGVAYDMQSHVGALTMLAISSIFGSAQPLLLTFSSERPVFMRESAGNMYGVVPYFLSKTMIEVPLLLLTNILSWLVAYWLMGFHGSIVIGILGTWLISLAAASTALVVACLVKDSKQAMEAAPGLFVPQIIFAGFFVKIELIPVWIRWAQYLCSLKWGMNILYINEFYGRPGGDQLLSASEIDSEQLHFYYLALLAVFLGFRLVAMVALARKAKAFYN
uniref:ABC transporter domain-containing protein n=1 Tax=Zooxanthella nutricula TaxID=1333877 RepID=A0A7S2JVU6_9DINO|mmetsp:Transcript_35856/g.108365  ORF Transcript_35856/g.108365 Transcript_35856/m.108365 type:complete len:629 (+) Transcript_35856:44-1930(+)